MSAIAQSTYPGRADRGHCAGRLLVLTAFAVLAYLPSLHAPFVFDDIPNIVLNARVQPDGPGELLDSLNARGTRDRPIPMFTFAVDYLRGGMDPRPYHVTSILVHVANVLVLFTVATALLRSPRMPALDPRRRAEIAFACALLWAVHPVNTQAVTYIVQRMATLAALFFLLAVLVFVLWRLGRMRTLWALPTLVVLYVAAVTSKANTATLPAALLVLDIAFFTPWRRYHTVAVGAVACLGVALLLYYGRDALGQITEAPSNRDFSGIERLLTQGRVIWHYLSLLALPDASRLQLDYQMTVSRGLFQPPVTGAAWVAILALAAIAACHLRRHPWLAAGWLFFLITISIESSFLLLELVFEHRVYLPSTLLVAGVVAPLLLRASSPRGRRAGSVAVLVLAGLLTWQTMERNSEWADFGGFWVGDLERGASRSRVTVNGAIRYLRQGEPEKALQLLEQADEDTNKVLEVRGETLMALGRYDEAIDTFRAVFERRPHWTRTAFYAGVSMIEAGRLDDARSMLAQIRNLHGTSLYAAALAANIDQAEGRLDEAEAHLLGALEERNNTLQEAIFIHLHLGNLYLAMERPSDARDHYRAVVERNPQQWVAWGRLYWLLRAGGSSEQARTIARYMEEHGVDPEAFQ